MQNYIIRLNFATFPHSEAYYFNYFSPKSDRCMVSPIFFQNIFSHGDFDKQLGLNYL